MHHVYAANIIKLLKYLRQQRNTPMGDLYYHGSYRTCSLGFAVVSKMFNNEGLDATATMESDGSWSLNYTGSIATKARSVFGDAYVDEIADPQTGINNKAAGLDQLNAIILKIESFLRKNGVSVPDDVPAAPPKVAKVKPVNLDTAGKRILARIARMEKIVADIEKLGDDAKHFTVDHYSMQAQIDMLNDALAS